MKYLQDTGRYLPADAISAGFSRRSCTVPKIIKDPKVISYDLITSIVIAVLIVQHVLYSQA